MRDALPGSPAYCAAVLGKLWGATQLDRPEAFGEALVALRDVDTLPGAEAAFAGAVAVEVLLIALKTHLAGFYLERLDRLAVQLAERDWIVLGWFDYAHGYWSCVREGDAWCGLASARRALASFEQAGRRAARRPLGADEPWHQPYAARRS